MQIKRKSSISFIFLCLLVVLGCQKEIDTTEIDRALIHQNEDLRVKGKTKEVIDLNEKYIGVSISQEYKRGEVLGYINIANIYASIGEYKKGMLYLNKASALMKNEQDDYLKMRLYFDYGQQNYVMGLHDIALNYNSQALYYANKIKSDSITRMRSNMYTMRADFIYSKYKDSTLIYFHKGLKEENSELNNALLGNYYTVIDRNPDSASFYFSKSLKLLENQEYLVARRGIVYSFYGHYLLQENKPKEALEYYEKAADILLKTNRINKLPLIYSDIIQASHLLEDKETEEKYTKKYINAKDSLQLSANKATDIALTNAIRQVENYKNKENQNWIIIAIISIILLTILIISYIYRKRDVTKNYTETVISPDEISKSNVGLQEIISLAKKNDAELVLLFYDYNPQFIQSLYAINPELSNSDVSFSIMIWLGFSSKEIAQYSFMQHRSVQTKRTRLRKKLNVDSEIDLYKFLRNISSNS